MPTKKVSNVKVAAPVNGTKLFDDQAVDLFNLISKLPDPDTVLKQTGMHRAHLRTLLADDEIAQSTDTRHDAIVSTPWRFETGKDAEGDKVLEFLQNELTMTKMDRLLSCAWSAVLFGYSVGEAIYYKRDDGKIGLKEIVAKPIEWFEPTRDGKLMYYPMSGTMNYGSGIEVDTNYKFFLTRRNPSYTNPYGEALLSRLYWAWFFRYNSWKFWGQFLERFGTPLLVGKSADPKAMVAALMQAHQDAAIAIGRDDNVDTVGTTAVAGNAFDSMENHLCRRIQKVVLGQTLTSGTDGGAGGNRALGQIHENVRQDKRNADLRLIKQTAQNLVNALVALNFPGEIPPLFEMEDNTGLGHERATRDVQLNLMGVRFRKNYFTDRYDLLEDDFDLTEVVIPGAVTPSGQQPDSNKISDKMVPGNKDDKKKMSFGKEMYSQFTPDQQELEELADTSMAISGNPISPELIRTAVLAAKDPNDLKNRLAALLGNSESSQFSATLEKALYVADVLGYVNSSEA